jgi:hypothetical protein
MMVRENANKKVCEGVWSKEQWIRSRPQRGKLNYRAVAAPLVGHLLESVARTTLLFVGRFYFFNLTRITLCEAMVRMLEYVRIFLI